MWLNLERPLDEQQRMTLLDATEKMRRDRVLIEALIDDPSRLGPDFQPIKDLRTDQTVGLKSTGSGQAGTGLESTLALLESAQASGLVERLDWAFRCLAFDVALDRGVTAEVHITPEPETFGSPCPPRLATSFGRGRRGLKVAAEVHQEGFAHSGLDAAIAEWRGWGWRVILMDVSPLVDPAFLRRLDLMRPDAVLVDLALRRPGDPQLAQLLSWAADAGVEVHVKGIDNEVRRDQALALNATAGRGRLLGLPARL